MHERVTDDKGRKEQITITIIITGWAGPKCEHQIDECESNPCQNGGICIDVHADYMCACPFGKLSIYITIFY